MMTTGAAIKVLPSSGQPPVTGRRRCPATFMKPLHRIHLDSDAH
jgi:hypothetical protein